MIRLIIVAGVLAWYLLRPRKSPEQAPGPGPSDAGAAGAVLEGAVVTSSGTAESGRIWLQSQDGSSASVEPGLYKHATVLGAQLGTVLSLVAPAWIVAATDVVIDDTGLTVDTADGTIDLVSRGTDATRAKFRSSRLHGPRQAGQLVSDWYADL